MMAHAADQPFGVLFALLHMIKRKLLYRHGEDAQADEDKNSGTDHAQWCCRNQGSVSHGRDCNHGKKVTIQPAPALDVMKEQRARGHNRNQADDDCICFELLHASICSFSSPITFCQSSGG